MDVVAVDLGGTHIRFAIATIANGTVRALGQPTTLHTNDYASMTMAWEAFAARAGHPLPRAAALAIACPIAGDVLKLTNSPWILRPATLAHELQVDQLTLVNDFGAVGHAVAQLPPEHLRHIAGPDRPLPQTGVIAIVGPGTGLGVAHILRANTTYHVIETEGGHMDFAPVDSIDDAILTRLRISYPRVSAERVVSGPGLLNLYDYLAMLDGRPKRMMDAKDLWTTALEGTDSTALMALQRFCMSLGSVCGDIVLAQGAHGLVIGGGIGLRIADTLPKSGFASRFTAKGRMETLLASTPVKLIIHPEPGLFGAAAAFAREHAT
jgi:glucokinase